MKHSSPFPIVQRRLSKAQREAEAARARGYQITIEFRTHRGGLSWEETPVHGTYTLDERDAHIIAGHIAQYLANHAGEEVRWNVAGSLQGHFRQPDGGTAEFARAVLGPSGASRIPGTAPFWPDLALLAPDGSIWATWYLAQYNVHDFAQSVALLTEIAKQTESLQTTWQRPPHTGV